MMIYDPPVFTNLVINTHRVTTQQTIDVITNFAESFGDLLEVNDVYIDTFFKDTHSTNNSRAAAQIFLISKNVTQGLKSMLFELEDR